MAEPLILFKEADILNGEATVIYEGKEHAFPAGSAFKFDAGGRHAIRADKRFKMALLISLV